MALTRFGLTSFVALGVLSFLPADLALAVPLFFAAFFVVFFISILLVSVAPLRLEHSTLSHGFGQESTRISGMIENLHYFEIG